MRESIHSDEAPRPIGPYSQAVRAAGLVFVSGQIAIDPKTNAKVAGDVAAQTHQVLRNLEAVLQAAGSGLEKVVKTTVYMTDLTDFPVMNEVYGQYFKGVNPARATVEVRRLPGDAKVEIEAIALG